MIKNKIILDDMILTTEYPTTAGSKMLDGYKSLFEAEVVTKLKDAGFAISGKANVGELSLGLLGETSYFGEVTDASGNLSLALKKICYIYFLFTYSSLSCALAYIKRL